MKKDLAAQIASVMPELSKGKKRIAQTILSDYDKVAYMTAAKLSEMVGVSESTVVRFAIDLGFDGYPEFQHAVQELVRAKLTPNQRIKIAEERLGKANPIENVMMSDAECTRSIATPFPQRSTQSFPPITSTFSAYALRRFSPGSLTSTSE